MPHRPVSRERRALLVGAAALVGSLGPAFAQSGPGIVVVSRERILRESVAARRLREAEARFTAQLQARIDATKQALAAEEAELARLRSELAETAFEARVAEFDSRVRLARRVAQERVTALQSAFQDARAAIVAALPVLIERLRVESGAQIVLNADDVLAMDPSTDLTERAIALFDAHGPAPALPEIDFTAPLLPAADGAAKTPPGEAGQEPADAAQHGR